MAEIHATTMSPGKLELLSGWLPRQRWCTAKGRAPHLRKLGGYRLDDPAGQVGIEIMIVSDESGPTPVVYQVPLTYRGAPLAGAENALIGESDHGVLGRRWVYDACHDPVFVSRLSPSSRARPPPSTSRSVATATRASSAPMCPAPRSP